MNQANRSTNHERLAETVVGWRSEGQPRDPGRPAMFDVMDPTTGSALVSIAAAGRPEAERSVDVAACTAATWSSFSAQSRSRCLRDVANRLRSAVDDIALLITLETGKRLVESRAEVGLSADFFEWFADAAATTSSEVWEVRSGITHYVTAQPVGVVAVLTPWNFPVSIPARKLAPALAAGCTIVFKPSEVAPLSGLRLSEILDEVLPPGVVETVVGDAKEVTDAWITDRRVRALTFTGSTRVGRLLAAKGAGRFVRSVLELGGSAPFMVLEDADIAAAADCLAIAKFRNNGQSCIAANTAWVPRHHCEEFLERFIRTVSALEVGDPLDEETGLGPTCMPTDPGRLAELVEDASRSGAQVIQSGRRHDGGEPSQRDRARPNGFFTDPVVCVEPAEGARVRSEEIFGPVMPIVGYDDIDGAIEGANRSTLALAGYVCGRNEQAARAVASRLDVGIVGVNTATPNTPQIPFAPRRDSGLGVEGGRGGLAEFLAYQSVAVDSMR